MREMITNSLNVERVKGGMQQMEKSCKRWGNNYHGGGTAEGGSDGHNRNQTLTHSVLEALG